MIGREAMLLQGWPISEVPVMPWMDNHLLHSLAGNAVACPVLLALLLSTFVAVSWVDPPTVFDKSWTAEDEDDEAAALSLLASLSD